MTPDIQLGDGNLDGETPVRGSGWGRGRKDGGTSDGYGRDLGGPTKVATGHRYRISDLALGWVGWDALPTVRQVQTSEIVDPYRGKPDGDAAGKCIA